MQLGFLCQYGSAKLSVVTENNCKMLQTQRPYCILCESPLKLKFMLVCVQCVCAERGEGMSISISILECTCAKTEALGNKPNEALL